MITTVYVLSWFCQKRRIKLIRHPLSLLTNKPHRGNLMSLLICLGDQYMYIHSSYLAFLKIYYMLSYRK